MEAKTENAEPEEILAVVAEKVRRILEIVEEIRELVTDEQESRRCAMQTSVPAGTDGMHRITSQRPRYLELCPTRHGQRTACHYNLQHDCGGGSAKPTPLRAYKTARNYVCFPRRIG